VLSPAEDSQALMSTLFPDIRHALRLLIKDRSFSVTALVTLAICIAANTATFAVVRAVLLEPLPIDHAEELVLVYNSYPNAGVPRAGTSVPDLYDRLEAVPALAEQGLYRREGRTFDRSGGAERVNVVRGTAGFYHLLRMQPTLGRGIGDSEADPGAPPVAVLSHAFWQRVLGADPTVVGTSIRLDGQPVEVIGVGPTDVTFLWNDIDMYLLVDFTPQARGDDNRHSNNWQMLGRLAPGASMNQVQAQLDALNAANDERFPNFSHLLADAGFHTVAVALGDDVVRDIRGVLYLLWGGVLFVLLIGGVNLANLVMVRSSARVREMATRHAIGADLGRLTRQVLTETMVLALIGGGLGVLLGWWALGWVASLDLSQLPRAYEIDLDVPSVLVSLGLTVAVGLAIGLAPASRLWRMNLNAELREEGRGGTSGRRAHVVRRALAMAQVAIAFVLLVGAGLLFASFRAVLDLDFGFEPSGVETATITLPNATYSGSTAIVDFAERALEDVRAIPGVASAGVTTALPFGGSGISSSVILAEGYVMEPGESLLAPSRMAVSDGYFEALRVRLMSGRFFATSDTRDSPRVAIVDDRLAKKFWPGQDAVGKRLYTPTDMQDITRITDETEFITIVGVVGEVQMVDPRADFTPVGAYYFPFSQQPGRTSVLAIRTTRPTPALMSTVRQRLAGIDPGLPLYRVQPVDRYIDDALAGRRVPMYVSLAFAGVGLFLAAVGIYGVLAYNVALRRRELGVRMALGGSRSSVFSLVLQDGLKITIVGLVVGVAGAVAVGRLMQSLLFGVSPLDPAVIAVVIAALAVVALVASVLPSWRAMRIDPIGVLGK